MAIQEVTTTSSTAMNRTLLFCLTLSLPQFAAAAPCDILPYTNQCQGSNLWPVPSGWAADNNGDCQPQAPIIIPALYTCELPSFIPGVAHGVGATKQEAASNLCAHLQAEQPQWDKCVFVDIANGIPQTTNIGVGCGLSYWARGPMALATSGPWNPHCWVGGIGYLNTAPLPGTTGFSSWSCGYTNSCTARWTSSAKTALQKDPLDPDCDAGSCVFDGTCKLR